MTSGGAFALYAMVLCLIGVLCAAFRNEDAVGVICALTGVVFAILSLRDRP